MKDWGMIVRKSDFLIGSNVAYKQNGSIIVSPAIASLIKDANEHELQLIIKNLAIIDFDKNIFDKDAFV